MVLTYIAIASLTGILGLNIFKNKKIMSYLTGMILITYLFMIQNDKKINPKKSNDF